MYWAQFIYRPNEQRKLARFALTTNDFPCRRVDFYLPSIYPMHSSVT